MIKTTDTTVPTYSWAERERRWKPHESCRMATSSAPRCSARSGMRATPHQVTIAVGDVHEDFDRAAEVARDCYDAGLQTLHDGGRFGDVAEAMLKPVEDAGAGCAAHRSTG
ncbi:MAG: hypothetical protein WBB00_04030 [Mycobacterium sp.]